jgi:signal transduction histidine kinase
MTLGFPTHLAPRSTNRSLAKGTHAAALACIVGAFLLLEAFQLAPPAEHLWPALIALVPVAVIIYFLDRSRTRRRAIANLVIGAVCLFYYTQVLFDQHPMVWASDALLLTLPKIALILSCGPSRRLASAAGWAVAGYVVGETAVRVGTVVAQGNVQFDVTAFAAMVAVIGIRILSTLGAGPSTRAQTRLHRAARDEELAVVRSRIELKASALLHDTVLNHLAAISTTTPGMLARDLHDGVQHDLEMLLSEQWLGETNGAIERDSPRNWETSELRASISLVRDMGLEVDVTGDHAVLDRLTAERASSLALAVHQCLVNVVNHADTDRAEVVLARTDVEVSVMVIDGGKGFSVDDTPADRLGLRQSVRRRVEAADGAVRIWSTPGRGTSVLIRLPLSSVMNEQ